MDLNRIFASVTAEPNRPLRLRNGLGRRITVLQGQLWLTQTGDVRDIVLGAGDDFVIDRTGAALLTALGGNALFVHEDGIEVSMNEAPHRSEPEGLLARLWHRYQKARRAEYTRNALAQLSDRTLKDIGLSRCQLGSLKF